MIFIVSLFLECSDFDGNLKSKTKRVRTTFTDEQLQMLQANFDIDSNPDGQDLERIAQITGLSKRVTQVWFQNSRARQKKHQTHHGRHRLRNDGELTTYKDTILQHLLIQILKNRTKAEGQSLEMSQREISKILSFIVTEFFYNRITKEGIL